MDSRPRRRGRALPPSSLPKANHPVHHQATASNERSWMGAADGRAPVRAAGAPARNLYGAAQHGVDTALRDYCPAPVAACSVDLCT